MTEPKNKKTKAISRYPEARGDRKPGLKTNNKFNPHTNAKSIKVPKGEKTVVLLSGCNPQIPKGEGDIPVQSYIAALPGWKSDAVRRLDLLIVRTLPEVKKAIKWNSPFYGIEGKGWFLGIHAYTRYIKVAFFRGMLLQPLPPGISKSKDARYFDIHENSELDEIEMASWVKQAAALPGWVP